MSLVVIKSFQNMTSLGLVQSYLDAEGIDTYVKDEYIGQVYGGAGVEAFGIKLQVRAEDAQQAIKLLLEVGYAKPEDYEPDEVMLKLSRFFEKLSRLFKKKDRRY